ncbi:hypothetical protein, partial [Paractinoplanes durhamensis]
GALWTTPQPWVIRQMRPRVDRVSERATGTIGLVMHPSNPVGESVATIADWVAGHSGRLLARS